MKCHCCDESYIKSTKFIYNCRNCGHIFRDYSHIDLDDYYNNVYRKIFKTYPYSERKVYSENIFKFITESLSLPKGSSIFEVGAGDGCLSKILFDNGFKVSVCELDLNLRNNLEKDGFETYDDFLKVPNKQFDTIVSTDVLEHILYPDTFYKKCLELDPKNIVIQVPINRDYTYKTQFDGHFHYFTVESLKHLFKSYHLKSYKRTQNNFSARGPELLCSFIKN
jgi:2-polyprenyl-3-methyl-5-hydroxy-6-metoxy-1,4-benzoquinol methylase